MSVTYTYYGHSTFAINADGHKIVVDPFFAPNNPLAPTSIDDIEAEFILITHGHGDHIADAVALAKRTGALVITNFEIVNWLAEQGVDNGHGMNMGGGYDFDFGRVKCTIAHHSSALPDGSNGGNPMGFVVTFKSGHTLYIAGDTALTYDMRLIGEDGGVDLAMLPIGDNFTMGPDDAVRAAEFAQAKRVIPVHYNTFPPIKQDPSAFANKLSDVGIECIVLNPGETYTV